MTRLLDCLPLKGCPDYKIQFIIHNDELWVRLSEQDIDKYLCFWSQSNEDGVSVEELLSGVSERLCSIGKEKIASVKDAVIYSPKGWGCWSMGIPSPLAEYLNYEFKDDIDSFSR